MSMGVCKGCRRFARGETCPFCGEAVGAPPQLPRGRRTRAGVLVGSMTAAVAIASCSNAQPAYGLPAYDAAYGGPPFDGSDYDGPVTLYGGPPIDAGDTGTDSGTKDANESGSPTDASDSG